MRASTALVVVLRVGSARNGSATHSSVVKLSNEVSDLKILDGMRMFARSYCLHLGLMLSAICFLNARRDG